MSIFNPKQSTNTPNAARSAASMVAAALFFDSAKPKSRMLKAVYWRSQRVPDSPTMTVAALSTRA
uniref:Uncharacterized protein n=1 Tax=Myoviridae sp. ctPSW2 TaxID=2826648 RepID=A0A8S5MNQ4_9CAUD|nr:MAG TPA: hypothetical protein [Myoviridae sp. ctPSW2]